MTTMDEDWASVRCLFETPIMDERKWAKIPSIPADAFLIALEDAVPVADKVAARAKAVEFLGRPEYFGGAKVLPQINPLDTPWGRDDLIALVEAGATTVMCPKVNTPDDVERVVEIARSIGGDVKVYAAIESARGVVEVERIVAMPEVIGAGFGAGDFHVDAKVELTDRAGRSTRRSRWPRPESH